MGLFDFVEAGLAAHNKEDAVKGSYAVTIGDALAAFILGGRQTHIFGAEAKFVLDYDELLFGKLFGSCPMIGALAEGIGGNTTFVYGRNIGATYIGPKVDVIRTCGPVISNKVESFFAGGQPDLSKFNLAKLNPAAFDDGDRSTMGQAIDNATGAAVAVLSVLMLGTAFALEVATACQYPNMSKDAGQAKAATGLKQASWAVTSRLMALIVEVEKIGALAKTAFQKIKDGKKLTEDEEHALKSAPKLVGLRVDMGKRLEKAEKAVFSVEGLVLAFLAAVIALLIGFAATRGHGN